MNIFHIILSKVSATITVILISFGFASPVIDAPAVDPVQVVVATATSTKTEEKPVSSVFLNPVVITATVATTTRTSTATTTVTVEATTSPVVVPVIPLQTNNQVAPVVFPQTVIIQVQQQEVPVASAPISMGQTYKLTTGEGENEKIILDNASELDIRDFATKLNSQINWKKQVRSVEMNELANALKSNGYTLTEK